MSAMKAIQITEYGGPDVLVLREVPRPQPGANEVLVRLDYVGAGFGDTYMRKGYYRPPHTYATHLPFIPGIDGVGEVVALGEGVTDISIGERVTYALGHHSYAEYAAVPAWKIVKVPADVNSQVACALMITGLTAYYLSHLLYPLGTGSTCLVHAGAGSVGQILIQLAHSLGAQVWTTVGSVQKKAVVEALGVRSAILYQEENFVERVRDETGGRGVDVVYDSVGLETYRRSMQCLRPRGVCALYGAASGIPECVRPMQDLAENGSIFVTRSHLAHYITRREELEKASSSLFELYRNRKVRVELNHRQFALSQAADAHRALEARETTGKILLKVR